MLQWKKARKARKEKHKWKLDVRRSGKGEDGARFSRAGSSSCRHHRGDALFCTWFNTYASRKAG